MKLSAKVERVLFPKEGVEDITFCILATNKGVCKGKMNWRPSTNQILTLDGGYCTYRGEQQFKFDAAILDLPIDSRSQLAYICENTPGIGKVMEGQIWEKYGDNWRRIDYKEIPKMTKAIFDRFMSSIQAFTEDEEKNKTLAWLQSKGATMGMASAAWEKWESDAIGIVNGNCYLLADLPHFGFTDVDTKVRQHFGILDDDPRRIRAAILYAMRELTDDGSTVTPWWALNTKIRELLPQVMQSRIETICIQMIEEKDIKIFPKQQMGALASHYDNGYQIYRFIKQSRNSKLMGEDELENVSKWIDEVSQDMEYKPNEQQKTAVLMAMKNSISIVNGGAGVGKTTIVDLIAKAIKQHDNSIVELCAFAGKAAARLKEATKLPASTIHKMLGSNGIIFSRTSLRGSTVIIDESSMVNSSLMAEIFKRNPDRVVLVGDQAQLPPVGPGQPFHDLLEIIPDLVTTLTICYRNKEAVYSSALKIRQGELPPLSEQSDSEKWEFAKVSDAQKAHDLICEWAKQGYIDFDQDIILCPKNGNGNKEDGYQEATVNGLNSALVDIVNPRKYNEKFLPGDRVMNLNNFADHDVWNGTTGAVHSVDQSGQVYVKLDIPIRDTNFTSPDDNEEDAVYKDVVLFNKEMVKSLTLAYALTVHKSQGSQYRKVILVCVGRDSFILDRSLVYTGVTRTKEECIVVGDWNTLHTAINKIRQKETVIQLLAINDEEL